MPPGPAFPDYVRDRLVAAMCDEGIGPKRAWRMAGAGELEGFDASWPVPSFTTLRDWRKLEERGRAERRIMDRDKPVGEVVDAMQRRVLKLCDRDLERLENAPPGKVDYPQLLRIAEAMRKIALATGAEKRPANNKKPADEKIPHSRVLESVQAVAAQSRATTPETDTGTSETGSATGPDDTQPRHDGQEDERSHLLQRAEERAQAVAGVGMATNGSSST